ncbi:MAG: XRE family transcriptional regulator [Gemmataceae bacterium]|nr:XRE family transcriptional regulator [Gemmataceae bacterium]
MTIRRITRATRLTPEEAARHVAVRKQIAEELPELIARHHERMEAKDLLDKVFCELKSEREKMGLSLADVAERTGMDTSALSKLETGQRPNPTFETLARYAHAVGKKLVVGLSDG